MRFKAKIRNFFFALFLTSMLISSFQGNVSLGTFRASAQEARNKSISRPNMEGTKASPAKYERRFNTITHELLDLETQVSLVDEAMYRLLDSIIDEARSRITYKAPAGSIAEREREALKILEVIDGILIRHNIVYPGSELTDLMSDGLKPTYLSGVELDRVLIQPTNARRRQHIQSHKGEGFYLADCDIASYVYLAVGEVLNLPLSIVEVPEHNFIRWYFNADSYLNWETMYGKQVSDEAYLRSYGEPQENINKAGSFFIVSDLKDILGDAYTMRGLAWEKKGRFDAAINAYRKATVLFPKSPRALNNLAWILATCPKAEFRNGQEAVRLAEQVVNTYITANRLDTLACAYAEAGDFKKAVEIEERAYRLNPKPIYQELIKAFKSKKTYVQYQQEKQ